MTQTPNNTTGMPPAAGATPAVGGPPGPSSPGPSSPGPAASAGRAPAGRSERAAATPILLIREKLSRGMTVVLGLIPVLLVLFFWQLATSGKMVNVELPAGRFEAEPKPAPEPTGSGAEPRRVLDPRVRVDPPTPPAAPAAAPHFVPGTRFPQTVTYLVPNARIDRTEAGRDLLVGQQRYALSKFEVPVRAGDEAIEVELPPGQITLRTADKLIYRFECVETRWYSPAVLPSLGEVVRSARDLWYVRDLPTNLWASLKRVVYGFVIAVAVCFPLGVLMGTFTKIKATFDPTTVFFAYLPIPAILPLFLLFFGMTEMQKYMYLALAFSIYLLPLFVQAVDKVDNVFLQTAYTLGASRWQVMTKVMLGVALPDIYTAMRLGFGVGWGYIILAEMVDMTAGGVGAMILVSQRQGPREHIYLILVAIVALAYLTDLLWQFVGDRFFPYRREKR